MASTKHDVIIIGAGLSGLSAATRLKHRCSDLDVLVVESGERIGGRTYSIDITAPDGTKDVLDLGGHWVGSTQKEVLQVMENYGLDYYKQNTDGEILINVSGCLNFKRSSRIEFMDGSFFDDPVVIVYMKRLEGGG